MLFNEVIHYACINIIFIDCLVSAVDFKNKPINELSIIIDGLKIVFYIWLGIYTYYRDWYVGMLASLFTLIIGSYTFIRTVMFYHQKKIPI